MKRDWGLMGSKDKGQPMLTLALLCLNMGDVARVTLLSVQPKSEWLQCPAAPKDTGKPLGWASHN